MSFQSQNKNKKLASAAHNYLQGPMLIYNNGQRPTTVFNELKPN